MLHDRVLVIDQGLRPFGCLRSGLFLPPTVKKLHKNHGVCGMGGGGGEGEGRGRGGEGVEYRQVEEPPFTCPFPVASPYTRFVKREAMSGLWSDDDQTRRNSIYENTPAAETTNLDGHARVYRQRRLQLEL